MSVQSVTARIAELQAILSPPAATPSPPAAQAGGSFRSLLDRRMASAPAATGAAVAAAPAATGAYPHLTGDLDAAPEVLAALEALARRRGETFEVTSGLRTHAEQERLWAARGTNPSRSPGPAARSTSRAAPRT